jgi:hypothetical protein
MKNDPILPGCVLTVKRDERRHARHHNGAEGLRGGSSYVAPQVLGLDTRRRKR